MTITPRDANVQRMRELLEQHPDGLPDDAAQEFDSCERRIQASDDIARRTDAMNQATNSFGSLLPDTPGDVEPSAPRLERAVGNLPAIHFDAEQIREAHAALVEHRAATITASETRAVTAPPPATIAGYQREPIGFDREPTRLASYLPTQPVESASVVFYRTTTAASAAATVAEAAAKPESTPAWTAVTVPVRKIAHWVTVSSEALADAPSLGQAIETDLIAGLILAESNQLLNGPGTGTTITGMLAASGVQTYVPAGAEARLLSILHGITMLRTGSAFVEADRIVMNPADWEIVAKYAASTGELIVTPNPATGAVMSLWGVPVTLTSQIAAGTILVGNLQAACTLFSREPAKLFLDPYGLSTTNQVRILCEERIALGVPRPTALVAITTNGTT